MSYLVMTSIFLVIFQSNWEIEDNSIKETKVMAEIHNYFWGDKMSHNELPQTDRVTVEKTDRPHVIISHGWFGIPLTVITLNFQLLLFISNSNSCWFL